MYSPFEAVYGHDRTHVRRMSVATYLRERDDDTSAATAAALNSRDPNVEFCSKYPVRDRFGRELCVLYQILEMDVQHELRRVERGGAEMRKSGVRLSAEVPRGDSDTMPPPQQLQQQQINSSTNNINNDNNNNNNNNAPLGFYMSAFNNPYKNSSAACAVGNVRKENELGVEENDEEDDVCVSASSRDQYSALVPPSVFSTVKLSTVTATVQNVNTMPNGRARTAETAAAAHTNTSSASRASSFAIYRDSGVNQRTQLPESRGTVSNTSSIPPAQQQEQPHHQNTEKQYLGHPNNCTGEADGAEEDEAVVRPTRVTLHADALRFTTVRPSELRATKQLFTSAPRRTVRHATPIPCQAYGIQSTIIRAALVDSLISANLSAACANRDFWDVDALTPELRVGGTLEFGGRRLRLDRYYASADVFAAHTETDAPNNEENGEREQKSKEQVLVYRWGLRAAHVGHNEAQRAALGLSLASPAVSVGGCSFRDGGVTFITLPKEYSAVPLSTVPFAPGAFPTCVKLLLKMLSDLVAKRTVHGGLRGLNCVFIAMRSDTESGAAAAADVPPALLVPVHWDKFVDFGMFVDRNAGRTIPLTDGDDDVNTAGRTGRHVYHSQDVAMIVNMLLEHELVADLTAEQLNAIRQLMTMTSEPTQVANYLIQLKNTMSAIPSDLISLRRDYTVALQCLS